MSVDTRAHCRKFTLDRKNMKTAPYFVDFSIIFFPSIVTGAGPHPQVI
jgi:hypothetical protein